MRLAICLVTALGAIGFAAPTALAANYTSASYAQRSHLIAQWDAIDNVGTGTHDPNATVWKNLASSGSTYDMTLTNSACWKNGDRLVVNGCSAVGKNKLPGYRTIEVVFRMTSNTGRILFTSGNETTRQLVVFDHGNGASKGYFSGQKDATGQNAGTHRCVEWHAEGDALRSLRSMTGVFTNVNTTAASVYGDGVVRPTGTVNNDFWPDRVAMIGDRVGNAYKWYGEVSTIRLYDCELTAEEIAQNHAIDVARFGEQLPSSADYVQEGLLVQWDGIDNAGTGVHDPNATIWKNLASSNGAYDLTLTNNATWNAEGRALVVDGVSAVANGIAPEYKTIEVVCMRTDSTGRIMFHSGLKTRFVLFDPDSGNQRAYFSGDTADNQSVVTKYVYQPYCASEINFLAGRYDDNGKVTDVFKDANQREDGARGNSWGTGTGISIGGRANTSNPYPWYGEVYAIRLYNRRLTKAELARNHRIDCKRFLTSSSYIREGLTAHWDGTDNVGRGLHDSSATTWKNLVSGGLDLTIGSGVWTDAALMSVGSSTMAATGTTTQAYNTLEVVYMNANHSAASIAFSAGLANRILAFAGNRVQWRNSWATTNFSQYTVGRYSLTGILTDNSEAAYVNGAKIQYGAYSDSWGQGASYVQVGGRIQSGSYYAFTGDIFAIRTYNSTFTPEKVAYNYKVDRRRFGLDAQVFTWDAGDGLFTNKNWTAWGQATANVPGASDAVALPAGDYAVTLDDETVVESLSVGAGAKLKMTLPSGADATNTVPLTVFGDVTADAAAGLVLDAKAFGKNHPKESITLIACETDSAAALQTLADNLSFVNANGARNGKVAIVDGRRLVYTAPSKGRVVITVR